MRRPRSLGLDSLDAIQTYKGTWFNTVRVNTVVTTTCVTTTCMTTFVSTYRLLYPAGYKGPYFQKFKSYCCEAFNILRKHASLIINLHVLMKVRRWPVNPLASILWSRNRIAKQ